MLPCSLSKVISMSEINAQVINELKTAGKDGLLIDELVDRLGSEKKQIMLALTTLLSEGRIMQKQEFETERYVLKPALTDDSEPSGLSDMNGCPCFHCLRIAKCGVRQPDSPVNCKELEEWMGTDIR